MPISLPPHDGVLGMCSCQWSGREAAGHTAEGDSAGVTVLTHSESHLKNSVEPSRKKHKI